MAALALPRAGCQQQPDNFGASQAVGRSMLCCVWPLLFCALQSGCFGVCVVVQGRLACPEPGLRPLPCSGDRGGRNSWVVWAQLNEAVRWSAGSVGSVACRPEANSE